LLEQHTGLAPDADNEAEKTPENDTKQVDINGGSN